MVNYFFNKPEEGKEQLVHELEMLQYALDQSAMIMMMNATGNIIDLNQNYRETMKYSLTDLYMQDFRVLNTGYHSEAFFEEIERALQAGDKWSGVMCQKARDGKACWLQSVIIPVRNDGDQSMRFMIVSVDITEQRSNERWQYLACHNELTTLPNRRMLDLSMTTYIGRAKQQCSKLAVLFLDINQFKVINDTYGHAIGDLFLQEVANRLSSLPILRNHVFHLSGDEFIMILEEVDNMEEQVHLILSLFDNVFAIESCQIDASASIGISIYPDQATDQDVLIHYADAAMFEAKRYQGNSYWIYQ